MKEALYYKKEDNYVKCLLCPRSCNIKEGKIGSCLVRKNINNTLYALTYNKVTAINLDPIEKKPLYHFYPSKLILSLGTYGCNFSCCWCQNYHMSQNVIHSEDITKEEIIKIAKKYKNNVGIAYTYNEPLIQYEFVLDVAKLAKEHNLMNVLVTNGCINKEPLENLLPYIDALNIDIKSMEEEFYNKMCNNKLEQVLYNAKLSKEKGAHVEITYLIIPTLNDKEATIRKLVNFIYDNLGEDTPLHFSRYFPHYKLDIEQTPLSTLKMAKNIATKKLKYVYIGNVYSEDENTYCPNCKKVIIERIGYNVAGFFIKDNRCQFCTADIKIIY